MSPPNLSFKFADPDLASASFNLVNDSGKVVYLSQAFEESATIHSNRPILRRIVAVISAQRKDVSVKN